ncbi:hypothetical protein PIB30_095011, partial [Stylosanthes scabra]|nr:hypothetical protein [Stylosanthes scabra]
LSFKTPWKSQHRKVGRPYMMPRRWQAPNYASKPPSSITPTPRHQPIKVDAYAPKQPFQHQTSTLGVLPSA